MRLLFFTILLTFLSTTARAQIFEWQSNNIQILNGTGFELSDDNRQTTLTFEHADGWKYGDNFFYVDYNVENDDDINAEFSPRLSLGKISGKDLSIGFVKDFLVAATWEKARRFDAYLLGIGTDLEIPGFSVFQINLYGRDNPDFNDYGWQTTWVWSRPFAVNGLNFTFDGYFDYADYEEGDVNFFTQPQLLMDIGQALGISEPGNVWGGIEYRYWNNKYGIEGVDEEVPQAMVKWVF